MSAHLFVFLQHLGHHHKLLTRSISPSLLCNLSSNPLSSSTVNSQIFFHSNRYRRVTTQRRIWLALGLCWLLSFLVGLTPMFGWNMKHALRNESNGTTLVCQFRSVVSMDYMVYFSFFTWILVPLVIMCIIYLDIFYIIRNRLSQNLSNSRETGAFYGREFKTAKSLFLILFLFALSWLPLSIINCINYFNGDVPQIVQYLGILLSHANSMMNPIVYACKIKKFKETYFFILKAYVICQPSESLNISQTS